MRPLEIWGGIECSVVRIGTTVRNQLTDTGHHARPDDIALLGRLGLKTLRYPVLWELIEKRPGTYDWRWTDQRMALLRAAGLPWAICCATASFPCPRAAQGTKAHSTRGSGSRATAW